jgi:hypothetical protein
MKWNELKKDDTIYLCIPKYSTDGMFQGYLYQESKVISNKKYSNYDSCHLTFKYSANGDGKRTKVKRLIYPNEFELPYIFSDGIYCDSNIGTVIIGITKKGALLGLTHINNQILLQLEKLKFAYENTKTTLKHEMEQM